MKKKVALLLMSVILVALLTACGGGKDKTGKGTEPTDQELHGYALEIMRTYYEQAEAPWASGGYKFTKNGLRYKAEGMVSLDGLQNTDSFYVVFEFDDDSYTTYTVESVEIGGEKLKKKQ